MGAGARGMGTGTGGMGAGGMGAGTGGMGDHGGMGGNGVVTGAEAKKWKQDAQYAFNKSKQVSLLTDWLEFRQIDLVGAEWIMNSTDQSNQCEVARLLARQCTEDRAKVKAQFRNHMHSDNWTTVFGK